MHRLINGLNVSDFYHAKTKSVFQTIKDFDERGILPDTTNIWENNKDVTATEISQWMDSVESIQISENYIRQMKEYTLKRSAVSAYQELRSLGENISQERIMEKLSEIKNLNVDFNYKPVHIREVLKDVFQKLLIENNVKNLISFGFNGLDETLYGIENEELVVVAGSTSIGKTSWAINQLIKNSVNNNILGAYFAIESGNKIIVARIISQMTRIPLKNIIVNNLNHDEKNKVLTAWEKLSDSSVILDDTESLSVNRLKILAETYKIENNLRYIIIDHLNEMSEEVGFRSSYQARSFQVSEIKKLARHLKIPIILLCQLSRAPQQRKDKTPIIFDLRDSGRIEEIADKIVLLYQRDQDFIMEIAKNRNGPKIMYRATFIPECAAFMSDDYKSPARDFSEDYKQGEGS